MIPLQALKILPRSPWRTPWHADTLAGALLATCARVYGPKILRDRLIDPMLAGQPPFVLSDAFPGDLLPMPVHLRLAPWSNDADRKTVKRARYLAPEQFAIARAAEVPSIDSLLPEDAVLAYHARNHNTLSRATDTSFSSEEGGGIYQRAETTLLAAHPDAHLTLYFRAASHHAADLLLELLHQLSLTGFGADTSTGRGQFDLPNDPAPATELDAPPAVANAVISLSTFQPAPDDPADGYWDAFPKFGKLGPELSSLAGEHRKNTLILLRPGGVFRGSARTHLGHAIPMRDLLPQFAIAALAQHGINIIHPAFGLTIPLTLAGDP